MSGQKKTVVLDQNEGVDHLIKQLQRYGRIQDTRNWRKVSFFFQNHLERCGERGGGEVSGGGNLEFWGRCGYSR